MNTQETQAVLMLAPVGILVAVSAFVILSQWCLTWVWSQGKDELAPNSRDER